MFLKSALHINIGNLSLAGDDGLVPQSASGRVHSLDSNYTTDVLRWVNVLTLIMFSFTMFVFQLCTGGLQFPVLAGPGSSDT